MSKVIVVFEMAGVTHKEYDAIMDELRMRGKTFNQHRPSHVSFNRDGKWCVIDVWDSAEALNEFVSSTLAPVFLKRGIEPPPPMVYPVHYYMGLPVDQLISA